jgi:hypothetical protein
MAADALDRGVKSDPSRQKASIAAPISRATTLTLSNSAAETIALLRACSAIHG